ncbi:50S ribosomal protein L15e [Candidatus Pacearchaeota archaeon]|nr:50S ribosomal protein L15e [Candidatus Pacearchaeota archaeon]
MARGMYYYLRQAWKKPSRDMLKSRLIEWRKGRAVTRLEDPTRIDRARSLGYKAKTGFIIVRVKILRGGRTKTRPSKKGRRSKRQSPRKILRMNYQWVAEQRAARKFPGLEVLNSYFLAKDGMNYFYEVILVDKSRPEIQADESIKWICSSKNRGRVYRGLTSSARKSRGLRKV